MNIAHSLFDSSGEGEDDDDLFFSPQMTGAATTNKTGKVKPVASKDMDALFDEVDLGAYVCMCTVFVCLSLCVIKIHVHACVCME